MASTTMVPDLHEVKSGGFYRTCKVFPSEMNDPSPCKSHAVPLVGSPIPGVPLRVTEDTSIWFTTKDSRVKIGKGRTCYVAEFDPLTNIAVIFLCTTSGFSGHNSSRFVRVFGAPPPPLGVDGLPLAGLTLESSLDDGRPMLQTEPPYTFKNVFYLNISHPIRVRVVHVSTFAGLRQWSLPPPPPPPVAIAEQILENMPPARDVGLHPQSEEKFWALHKAYHEERPFGGTRRGGRRGRGSRSGRTRGGGRGGGTGGGGRAGGGGGTGGGGHAGGGGRVGGGGRAGGGGRGGGVGIGVVAAEGVGSRRADYGEYRLPDGQWRTDVAPWGRIGELRVGFDIPLVVGRAGSDESEPETESEAEEDTHIWAGVTLCLGDVDVHFGELLAEMEDEFALALQTTESARASFEFC